jgi:hypothetical protein
MANKAGERVANTATEALKVLREASLFRGWKKNAPIVQPLAKRGNNFSDAELRMALKRARHSTRRGKRGSYEYIQKCPSAANEEKAPQGAEKERIAR